MRMNPRHLLTAMAALAGLSAQNYVQAESKLPAAVQGSSRAIVTESSRRARLPFFNFDTALPRYRSGGLFRHSKLSQRQRRKFNRQKHAAGDKHAFA